MPYNNIGTVIITTHWIGKMGCTRYYILLGVKLNNKKVSAMASVSESRISVSVLSWMA